MPQQLTASVRNDDYITNIGGNVHRSRGIEGEKQRLKNFVNGATTFVPGSAASKAEGVITSYVGKLLTKIENEATEQAAKAGGEGGLNLFKWGAEQTGKSTGWKTGDYFLNLPNKGTPALNWKANYGALRSEMNLGKPIFDSYRLPNGNLIPTGGFLNAERYILQTRGWMYSPGSGAWMPPIR